MLETATIHGYQLRLASFEGPLDVLLRLIERSQFEITDVSLVSVTGQFLAYVDSMDNVTPDVIADFTTLGARLVLLKSRSLLPRPAAVEDDESASDLTRELVEYRAVKLAALNLAERDRRGDGAFARALTSVATVQSTEPPKLAAHDAGWLARAIRRRLTAVPSPRSIMLVGPIVTLREMVERVLKVVGARPETSFSTITRGCSDTHEVRTAFLAILVLIRRQVIEADQPRPFGEISLHRISDRPVATAPNGVAFALED